METYCRTIISLSLNYGVTKLAKCDLKIAELNIRIFPKMRKTGYQTCMRASCVS